MLLTSRFDEAFRYAHQIHAAQVRKGTGAPYIGHLMGVASIVLDDGGSEDEAIAALLHDAAEDQGGHARLEDIRSRFGDRVADIVEACSDTFEDPKPPWKPRKEAFLARFADERDQGILRVEVADKLHNARQILRDLRTTGDRVWDRFNAPKPCQLWYYRSLVTVLRKNAENPLVDELDAVVTEIEERSGGPSEGCPDEAF